MTEQAASLARPGDEAQAEYWWKKKGVERASCRIPPRPGHTCPECGEGTLAYDGLFVLNCDRCGYVAESGASW